MSNPALLSEPQNAHQNVARVEISMRFWACGKSAQCYWDKYLDTHLLTDSHTQLLIRKFP